MDIEWSKADRDDRLPQQGGAMEQRPEDVICNCFSHAVAELFECYLGHAVQLCECEEENSHSDMTAVIGFAGSGISATLILTTCEPVALQLAKTAPLSTGDWLAELVNQLAGRLKNKLLRFGVSPSLSTPAVIHGKHLRITTLAKTQHRDCVTLEEGQVIAKIMLELEDSLELVESEEERGAAEGSLQLF